MPVMLRDGKVLRTSSAVIAIASSCCCDVCPYDLTVEASVSGTVSSSELCGEVAIPISGATTEPTACTSGSNGQPCDCLCLAPLTIDYECPDDCYPVEEKVFDVLVGLVQPDCPDGNWFLILSIEASTGDRIFCGRESTFGGGEFYSLDIGEDPIDTHVLSFDDPSQGTVHWDITITVE